MGRGACALALVCALTVARAAAYTVDCNHEYTDCDTELSKLGDDDDMILSSSSYPFAEAEMPATTPQPSAPNHFLPTNLPPLTTTTLKTTTSTTNTEKPAEPTESPHKDIPEVEPTETSEIKELAKEPRLLNINVDELQNFANALHNQTSKHKDTKIDLSDVNMDDDDEETTRIISHDHSKHNKPIPDKFYTNLQMPFNPLLALDRELEDHEICKENDNIYKVGERFDRGCEETCECQPGGSFECTPRCKHPYIRRGRRLSDPLCFESPVDECCSIIACATGNQDVKANKVEVCRYNNETHVVGEKWNVGCDLTCSCAANSAVTCLPRCKKLLQSDKCINVQDPNDACCEVQVCDVSQDVHEEPENVTSSTAAPTSSSSSSTSSTTAPTELSPVPGFEENDSQELEAKSSNKDLPIDDHIGSVTVLQNNSVEVNLMRKNSSDDPIHLLLSNDGGKTFKEVELKYSNLILNLPGGKDYILKSKETGAKFNFTITQSEESGQKGDLKEQDQGCYQDGQFYKIGEEFHIGCTELCECTGPNNERECVELVCPSHVGLELVSKGCVRWAPNPPPTPPNCCPRAARCLSDGTCHYKGIAVPNWSEVPIALTGCEQRCFCENGELDCQEVCTPLPPVPPQSLRCPPHHRPAPLNISDEDCCKHWGCLPNVSVEDDSIENLNETKHYEDLLNFATKTTKTELVLPLTTPATNAPTTLAINSLRNQHHKAQYKLGNLYRVGQTTMKTLGGQSVKSTAYNQVLTTTEKPAQKRPDKIPKFSSEEVTTVDEDSLNLTETLKASTKFQYFDKDCKNCSSNSTLKDTFTTATSNIIMDLRFPEDNVEDLVASDEAINDIVEQQFNQPAIQISKPTTDKPFTSVIPTTLASLTTKKLQKFFMPDYSYLKSPTATNPNMFFPFVSLNKSHGFYEDSHQVAAKVSPQQNIYSSGKQNYGGKWKELHAKQPKIYHTKVKNYADPFRPNVIQHLLFKAVNPYEAVLMKPMKLTKTALTPRIQSPLEVDQLANQMDREASHEASRNLGRSAKTDDQSKEETGKQPPTPDKVMPGNSQAPFLPTVPPEIHFPTEDIPDYDQNNLHRPTNPGLKDIPPGFTIPPNYGEENKKLTVLSIQADSPTSVKLLFGLPPVLVGLRGSVDLRYTDLADEDISHWYSQVFAPADEVLTTPRLEFRLTGLKPSTIYKIKGKLFLHNLPVEPESPVYSVKTLDLPSIQPIEEKRREVNSALMLVDVNDTAAHVSWRHFTEDELRFIDGIQVRYRPVGTPIYSMTELLHHSRSIAELHDLRPGTKYEASLVLVPPPRAVTELYDPGRLEFTTAQFVDPYNWSVTIESRVIGSDGAELTWRGVPAPAERWVRVYRAAHACGASRHEHDAFRLAARDLPPTIMLKGLQANTRCRVWLELFLTNGKIKTSNVLEINTKSEDDPANNEIDVEAASAGSGVIRGSRGGGRGDYYGALVVVGVVAALGALTSLLLLLVLVRRHRPRSVPITPVPSAPRESSLPPYDNPAYKLELQQETMEL